MKKAILLFLLCYFSVFETYCQYVINASANPGGKVILSGELPAEAGASQQYLIEPMPGFKIAHLELDNHIVFYKIFYGFNGAFGSYTIENIRSNHNLRATFEKASYFSIVASAGSGGTIIPSGKSAVAAGANSATYTISAAQGFGIEDVLIDNISVGPLSPTTTFTYQFNNVQADHTIKAVFVSLSQNKYKLTATSTPGGKITPASALVNYGSSTSFTLTPDPGFVITALADNKSELGQLSNNKTFVYTVSNVKEDHSIKAFFDSAFHTVTGLIGSGQGHGTITPQKVLVKYGASSPVFTIHSNPGYVIEKILLNGTPLYLDPKDSVLFHYTLQDVYTTSIIEAYFVPASTHFNVVATAGKGGVIKPGGNIAVKIGDSVQLKINASQGYTISQIVVDNNVISQYFPVNLSAYSYTFYDVHANHKLSALFTSTSTAYTISAKAGANGTVMPLGNTQVKYGDSLRINIAAHNGYRIQDILVDGKSVADNYYQLQNGLPLNQAVYTFYHVTSAHSIGALFAANQGTVFRITKDASPEIGNIYGPELVDSGANQSYQIVPRSPQFNVALSRLLVDGYPVDPVGTYTFKKVNSDHMLTADFELKPDCKLLNSFNVPRSAGIPFTSRNFNHLYVITDALQDDLGGGFFQWNPSTDHLDNFYIRPKNGNALIDLSFSSQNLSSPKPAITIVNTNLPTSALFYSGSIDNVYWINLVGEDLVLVAKSGTYALVFSNNDQYQFHCSNTAPAVSFTTAQPDAARSDLVPAVREYPKAFPNPFVQTITISYFLPTASHISIYISDAFGRRVGVVLNNTLEEAGDHTIEFDGSRLPSGTYYYTVQSGQSITSKPIIHIRN